MHEGFLHALISSSATSDGKKAAIDEELKNGWNQIWQILKNHIGQGIAIQRQNYMTECVTKAEISSVKAMWEKIIETFGIKEAGEAALDLTIETYTPERGFQDLPQKLKMFVMDCLMIEVCPTLIRKAFMDGDEAMSEINIHAWSKIYRILEQIEDDKGQ
uniref:Uncharacterized protein n=1 Tax=Panagrolaimus davidi TaxID=227884 RepID=A0A914PPN1_9BILA